MSVKGILAATWIALCLLGGVRAQDTTLNAARHGDSLSTPDGKSFAISGAPGTYQIPGFAVTNGVPLPATVSIIIPGGGPPPPGPVTFYTFVGPSTGAVNQASLPFTATLGPGAVAAPLIVTATTSGPGSWFPGNVTLTDAMRSASMAYTPTSSGAHTLSVSVTSTTVANPPNLTYAVTGIPPVLGPLTAVAVYDDNALLGLPPSQIDLKTSQTIRADLKVANTSWWVFDSGSSDLSSPAWQATLKIAGPLDKAGVLAVITKLRGSVAPRFLGAVKTKTGHSLPAFLTADGEVRYLGRVIRPGAHAALAAQPFKAWLNQTGNPVVDLNTLPAYDRCQVGVPILDQDQIGSCTAHACTAAMMKARDLAGMTFQLLSPDSLYAGIDGGQDQGSDPADGIKYMQDTGICLNSDIPDKFILLSNIPPAALATAKRFRIVPNGVYQCQTFAEMVTADYFGFSIILTINVGNNFGPAANGIVGFTGGGANHCVSGGEAFAKIGGTPAYRFRNSWTTSWGQNGYAWCTAQHIDGQPYLEVYAIQWALKDPLDVSNPPQPATAQPPLPQLQPAKKAA